MFRTVSTLFAAALFATPISAKPFAEMFPDLVDADPDLVQQLEVMDYKQGGQFIGDGVAKLDVPDGYYFLDANDARYVIETLWGNPSDPTLLGMVFPDHLTPFHEDSWGVTYQFEDIGYVDDADASGYDYDDLLQTMRADLQEENKWRASNGYPSLSLVGWAETPYYDQTNRKLHWAKELSFADTDANTLNYNIRVLGRKGVLVMNFIAGMESLPEVSAAVPDLMSMSNFTEGNTYSDFDPSVDKVAAVGIGGLIAGKVLAKTGFLTVLLVLLKKFWFLAFIPLIALKNMIFKKQA